MKKCPVFTILCLSLVLPLPAWADLIGDTVNASAFLNNAPGGNPETLLSQGSSAVVSATDPEFSVPIPALGGAEFSMDLTADTLTIIFNPDDPNNWPMDFSVNLTDLDWVGQAGRLATMTQTFATVPGFLSTISIGNDSMDLDSTTNLFGFGSFFIATYDFTAVHDNTPTIPEPSTILLLGSGLAGLAAWRYRKGLKA